MSVCDVAWLTGPLVCHTEVGRRAAIIEHQRFAGEQCRQYNRREDACVEQRRGDHVVPGRACQADRRQRFQAS